ncbi:uncharacterized protein TM35_000481650, partial [Trypanosoma theileri]
VEKTRKAAEAFNNRLTEIEKLANTIISDATEFEPSSAKLSPSSHQTFLDVENVFEAGKREGEDAQSFVAQAKSSVQMTFDAAKKAEKQAKSLNLAVESFQKYLEKHGLKPEEEEADKVTPGNKNEESKLESSHEMKTTMEEENTAQLHHSSHEEVKNVHMNTTNINGITK